MINKHFQVLEHFKLGQQLDTLFAVWEQTEPWEQFSKHSFVDSCFCEISLGIGCTDSWKNFFTSTCNTCRLAALTGWWWVIYTELLLSISKVTSLLLARIHVILLFPLANGSLLVFKEVYLFLKEVLDILQETLLMVEDIVFIFDESETHNQEHASMAWKCLSSWSIW